MTSGAHRQARCRSSRRRPSRVLRAEYPIGPTASQKIPQAIADFYKTKYPDVYQSQRAVVETAAQQVNGDLPAQRLPRDEDHAGARYPNNLGHDDFLGCFRCHDGKHKSSDGRVITDDCSACHQVLAMEEKDPKVLSDLGLK